MILSTYHNLVLSRQEQTENIKHLHFVHKLEKEEKYYIKTWSHTCSLLS